MALIDHGDQLPSMRVSEVMTRGIASIPPAAKLDEVKAAFGEHGGIRRLLVVDGGGDLLGVVSWSDLAAHASAVGVGELVKRAIEGT